VTISELRKLDPSGATGDQVLSSALAAQIITITPGATGKLTYKLDPTLCGSTCDFTKPSEFRVTFLLSCDPGLYKCTAQSTNKNFPIFKISAKTGVSYGSGTSVYTMQDAFASNFDTVSNTSYNWLKINTCSFSYTSCSNVSVL
jgi:hypothetical protein